MQNHFLNEEHVIKGRTLTPSMKIDRRPRLTWSTWPFMISQRKNLNFFFLMMVTWYFFQVGLLILNFIHMKAVNFFPLVGYEIWFLIKANKMYLLFSLRAHTTFYGWRTATGVFLVCWKEEDKKNKKNNNNNKKKKNHF